MSNRTYTHVIDTKAIKKVLNSLPDSWVVRELTERDYGTDLQVEIFRENGNDANGNTKYETSGCLLNLQVKGTDKNLNLSQENTIDFKLHRRHLLYFEKFSVPFILIRVGVSDSKTNSYFVWLQKYIKHELDKKCPKWRDENRPNNNGGIIEPNYKIEIPKENTLTDNIGKLKKVASQAKFIEQTMEFVEIFSEMKMMMEGIDDGSFNATDDSYDHLSSSCTSLSRLDVLFEYNNSQVSKSDINNLYHHLIGFKSTNLYSSGNTMDFDGVDNLKMLLEVESNTLLLIERLSIESGNNIPY